MDNNEKSERCMSTPVRGTGLDMQCRVYTRWVGECSDCSFDHGARKYYLRR